MSLRSRDQGVKGSRVKKKPLDQETEEEKGSRGRGIKGPRVKKKSQSTQRRRDQAPRVKREGFEDSSE
jgi:hypothetical protein